MPLYNSFFKGFLTVMLLLSCVWAQDGSYWFDETKAVLFISKSSLANSGQLQVYFGQLDSIPDSVIPAMIGQWAREDDYISFRPYLGFSMGFSYTLFQNSEKRFCFSVPIQPAYSFSNVTAIYPSADSLPANLLKIYLHFSQPMRSGFAAKYICLINEAGDTLKNSFLKLEPELWDEEQKRLTLWFDPGRIKRDLGPNQHRGTPLMMGQTYQILVKPNWPDMHGIPLLQAYNKSFYVCQADRSHPNAANWNIIGPRAQSRDSLEIHFGEGMDHALLLRHIQIVDESQEKIGGTIYIASNESVWKFFPDQAWEAKPYQIRIDSKLEDLAGNNLNRNFDQDLLLEKASIQDQTVYYLSFYPK